MFGERKIIVAGLLLNVTGMVLFVNAFSFVTLTIYLTITGIGYQLIRPTNTSWISKQTHIGQGNAIGIMDAFLSFGRVLGPILSGWLYDKALNPTTGKNKFVKALGDWLYGNYAYSYVILACILLIAACCLYLPLRRVEQKT